MSAAPHPPGRSPPHRATASPASRGRSACRRVPLRDPTAQGQLRGATISPRHGPRLHREVLSPGFAVYGRAREASLQVSAVSRPSAECLLAGACSEGPRWKSLTTLCRPGQRR